MQDANESPFGTFFYVRSSAHLNKEIRESAVFDGVDCRDTFGELLDCHFAHQFHDGAFSWVDRIIHLHSASGDVSPKRGAKIQEKAQKKSPP